MPKLIKKYYRNKFWKELKKNVKKGFWKNIFNFFVENLQNLKKWRKKYLVFGHHNSTCIIMQWHWNSTMLQNDKKNGDVLTCKPHDQYLTDI